MKVEKQDVINYLREYNGNVVRYQAGKKKTAIHFSKNYMMLMVISILLGRASILDGLAPFGIAFFITLISRDKKYYFLGLGVMAGIISGGTAGALKYAVVLFAASIIFSIAREKLQLKLLVLALMAAVTMFCSGLLYLQFTNYYTYDVFMLGFESVVVFVFVYIVSYAIPIILLKSNRKVLSNEELICIAISGAVAISGLSDVGMIGYSFKNIFGLLFTLIFAYNGGASIGAAVGITIGIITSMSTIGTPTIIGVYGFSGLLAGIFKDLGKIGSGIGIILGNVILTLYINGSTEIIIAYQEIIIALILFMLMPKALTAYMDKFVNSTASAIHLDRVYSDRVKRITYDQLREYADAFSELAATYGNILERNEIVEQGEVADIVDQVVNRVCNKCGMCRGCWQNNFYHTYNGVVDALGILETTGKLKDSKIPESLRKRCIKLSDLIQAIEDMYEIYKIHYGWQRKLFEGRQLVAEQFKGVSEIIGNLAKEVSSKYEFKTEIEDDLYVAFDKEGLAVAKVTALVKENGKLEVEIEKRPCFDRKQCDFKIKPVVSKIIGKEVVRKSNHCTGSDGKGKCTFSLVEAPKYRTISGVARVSKDNGNICGDNYAFIELENGKYLMALSDGMGTGERAARESGLSITLLEQLMEAGFDKDIAIKTINSILMLKSSDEMFASMDLSILDLYSGKVEFVKIGAASSFIKRASGDVEIVKSSSLPIGILNKIDIESFDKKIDNGDYVVMMSDGILDSDKIIEEKNHWVVKFLENTTSRNPQAIAEELLNKAYEKYGNKIEDDMTVVITKLW